MAKRPRLRLGLRDTTWRQQTAGLVLVCGNGGGGNGGAISGPGDRNEDACRFVTRRKKADRFSGRRDSLPTPHAFGATELHKVDRRRLVCRFDSR